MSQELQQLLFTIIMVAIAFATAGLLVYKMEKPAKKEK